MYCKPHWLQQHNRQQLKNHTQRACAPPTMWNRRSRRSTASSLDSGSTPSCAAGKGAQNGWQPVEASGNAKLLQLLQQSIRCRTTMLGLREQCSMLPFRVHTPNSSSLPQQQRVPTCLASWNRLSTRRRK